MTEHPPSPTTADDASSAARQARVAELAKARSTKGRPAKRRHPAQGARIAAAGLGATTMLGLVGFMGYSARPTPAATAPPAAAPSAQPQVVVVVHPAGAADPVSTTVAATPPAATTLTARPTVRPASPQAQQPAASTRGSG
jgi:hypothetical protein